MYFIRIYTEKPVFLEITPPSVTDKTRDTTAKLFSVIHSLGMGQSFGDLLLGRKILFSFEIVSTREKGIRYLIKTNRELASLVKSTLLSYLPSLTMREVNDYISGNAMTGDSTEFTLTKHYAYPLAKQDTKSSSDPVSYITGMMTSLNPKELIALHIIISPTNPAEVSDLTRKIMHNEYVLSYLNSPRFPLVFRMLLLPFVLLGHLISGLSWVISDLFLTQEDHMINRQMTHFHQMTDSRLKPKRNLSTFEQETVASIADKIIQPLFETTMRALVVSSKNEQEERLRGITSSLAPFAVPGYQSFKRKERLSAMFHSVRLFALKHRLLSFFTNQTRSLLSASELADLYHFPASLKTTENIVKNLSAELPAPLLLKQEKEGDVVFGKNMYGGKETLIGLTEDERSRHTFLTGQTGSGKSTILFHCAKDDIEKGRGICVVDPHGDLVEDLLTVIPKERIQDVVYINPYDIAYPISINLLEVTKGLSPDEMELEKELVVESIISLFRRLFSQDENTNSHRIEHILRNTIYTAFYIKDATLFTINKLLANEKFRKKILEHVDNEDLRDFWKGEFSKAGDYQVFKTISGVTAKIERFLFSPIARRMFEKAKSTLSFDDLLDTSKIILCNLSEGKIGEDTSQLIGTTIITKIHLSIIKRARMEKSLRKPFYLYIDEFQNFATTSFTKLLSGGRKFGLRVTIAEQSTTQQNDDRITQMILANVGTVICFRTASPIDEQLMLPIFSQNISQGDIGNLPRHHFYIRLGSIEPTEPFSGVTLPVDIKKNSEKQMTIIKESRKNYAKKYVKEKKTGVKETKKTKDDVEGEVTIDNGIS